MIIKLIVCIIATLFLWFISCFDCTVFAEEKTPEGGIKVEVINENGEPICGAKVFVCEISKCFETGKSGQTANISLPVLPDKRFVEICKKDFGEVTLLITKDGMCPTCVTGVIVRNGVTRLGPKITMKSGDENIHIADTIDSSWLKRFCDKYSKVSPVIIDDIM
ncbi:MAG: hypothetical protein R3Y32_07810 [Bacillota bacterium]